MPHPKLYRNRLIPYEQVHLKDDEIIRMDEDIIITKWTVLKPRKDFTHGVSCYFLKKGYKVSKFINAENQVIYIYCDIIETIFDEKENTYIFNDLLVDVIIYNNGFVKIMDMAEISDALEANLIGITTVAKALRQLDELLEIIYSNKLDELTNYLEI